MRLSLIERNIHNQMDQENIKSLPIRPSKMKTDAPTWRVIRQFFEGVNLAMILQSGNSIHSTLKGLTLMHEQVLQLMGVSPRYLSSTARWQMAIQANLHTTN